MQPEWSLLASQKPLAEFNSDLDKGSLHFPSPSNSIFSYINHVLCVDSYVDFVDSSVNFSIQCTLYDQPNKEFAIKGTKQLLMVAISHSNDNSQTLKHILGVVNDHCALNIYHTLSTC
jgi:hypothetical protein